jgi:hypothetical protein
MKLDPRILVPAALIAGAVALPSGASGQVGDDPNDPLDQCPDHFVPTAVILAPDPSKDRNENFIVCHKETPGMGDPTKDDNPDNWTDDILPLGL